MSRQLTLDSFYKSRISKTLKFEMDDANIIKKRFQESPTITSPSKTPKLKQEHGVDSVINLISDDEVDTFNSLMEENKDIVDELLSDSSNTTLNYTPPEIKGSPVTPKSAPGSSRKYFSPTKKRNVSIKTPSKVRKNLNVELCKDEKNTEFEQACDGLDDKTIFLLKIIYQYLHDTTLKPLLDQCSQDLLAKCIKLVKPGLRLVCRLYWRKEGWYRLEKLKQIVAINKEAIDDPTLNRMLNCLLESGLLVPNSNKANKQDLQFSHFIDMLKVNEVKAICKDLKLKVSNKDDAKQSLESFSRQSNISNYLGMAASSNRKRVLKMLSDKVGPCYKLSDTARRTLNELYILMYLGIDYNILKEKKLELVLLNDKVNRETYPIDKSMVIDNAGVVFKSREEFQRYLTAGTIYENFSDSTDSKEKCKIVENVYTLYLNISKEEMTSYKSLPVWLRKFTPVYFYIKILETGVADLKKISNEMEGYCQLALDILTTLIAQDAFRIHKKAEWYAEKALIYEKLLKSADKAAEVLLEGLELDIPEEEKDCMRPRALKLANRQTNKLDEKTAFSLSIVANNDCILEKNINAKHICKQPMEGYGRGKIKFEVRLNESRMILEAEEFCILHYINSGEYTHGGHWEGRIITTLFFLLFWDIIYANLRGVRGVFLTHYQTYPLDMFEGFYTNRKCLIEERLKEIQEGSEEEIIERMKRTWDARPEGEVSGVARAVGWAEAEAVARCLRGAALGAVCARLGRSYRHAHSGFPDLTLWNPLTRQIMFVEVKTDSDKPSVKQIQWMNYLQQHGIKTEFCYVGVNTTRCKARNAEGS